MSTQPSGSWLGTGRPSTLEASLKLLLSLRKQHVLGRCLTPKCVHAGNICSLLDPTVQVGLMQ